MLTLDAKHNEEFLQLLHHIYLSHAEQLSIENILILMNFYRDLYTLLEDFLTLIHQLDFRTALTTLQHFHVIWVESAQLHDHFSKVEAYTGSLLSSLTLFVLGAELAWLSHFTHSAHNGFAMLSISVGMRLYAPIMVYGSFFKKYNQRMLRQPRLFLKF